MALKLSKEFVVKYGGTVIARCVDFDFMINKTVIDLTTLDSDSWREIMADQKDWSINFNALIAREGTTNYDAMLNDIKNNDDAVEVAVGDREAGGQVETGDALITQLRFTARVGERAAYAGTLDGTGELVNSGSVATQSVYYSNTGAITSIDPGTVTFATQIFSVPLAVTTFTFDDGVTGMTATKTNGVWSIQTT